MRWSILGLVPLLLLSGCTSPATDDVDLEEAISAGESTVLTLDESGAIGKHVAVQVAAAGQSETVSNEETREGGASWVLPAGHTLETLNATLAWQTDGVPSNFVVEVMLYGRIDRTPWDSVLFREQHSTSGNVLLDELPDMTGVQDLELVFSIRADQNIGSVSVNGQGVFNRPFLQDVDWAVTGDMAMAPIAAASQDAGDAEDDPIQEDDRIPDPDR